MSYINDEEFFAEANSRKRTRKVKVAGGSEKPVAKPKFEEVRKNVPPLVPMNELQAEYIRLIQTKRCIIATGYAGTSKTFIPTVIACDKLRKGEIKRIYLSRPNISNSKSLGFFSGDHVQKMSMWLLPILSTMYDRLGKNVVDLAIKSGDIQFVPLETIKGMSFGKETFVIVDEAEDLTIEEVKSVLTRQGGCTMVLAGDLEQSALSEKSGLAYVKRMVEKYPNLEGYTGFVDFNRPSDIVRSAECRAWILAFREEGK
jgi:phosphate starvation-inducible PhoH-like protein